MLIRCESADGSGSQPGRVIAAGSRVEVLFGNGEYRRNVLSKGGPTFRDFLLLSLGHRASKRPCQTTQRRKAHMIAAGHQHVVGIAVHAINIDSRNVMIDIANNHSTNNIRPTATSISM